MRYSLLFASLLGACAAAPEWADDPDVIATPGGRLAARIVREPHDPDRHQETSKVFHHVYAPDGRLLTKGTGGLFGHHRGLFLGWNQLQHDGRRLDFWHCNSGELQQWVGLIGNAHSRLEGWQASAINWLDPDGKPVLTEVRMLRARELGDATVLELVSRLQQLGDVLLAGDPQHAGQQFRALQMFGEDDGPEVDYLRPASATEHGNDVWKNCDWIAAVLPMPDSSVTVLRIEGRDNPKPASWSTRAYGRFGATFTHRMPRRTTADQPPLELSWTYVIADGRRDLAWCEQTVAELAQSPEGIERISVMTR